VNSKADECLPDRREEVVEFDVEEVVEFDVIVEADCELERLSERTESTGGFPNRLSSD
jgi:hypothetical protein